MEDRQKMSRARARKIVEKGNAIGLGFRHLVWHNSLFAFWRLDAVKNILVTGGAGFIGSNLVLSLQKKFPDSRISVIDDFRSGHFSNLAGYQGDIVAADVSRLDFGKQFQGEAFDAIFHHASITDTTVHDQRLQVHDNVEGFRRVLDFAAPHQTPVVYASSAAAYGTERMMMEEEMSTNPANVYAFSKAQMDNLARIYTADRLDWRIVGLRYFNVYGPRESHKKMSASMIYQLYCQMKAGKSPRVFADGQQKRDFVFIDDVVELTIRAMESQSRVYNCGSGVAFSFNEVIQTLNRALGTNLAPEYFENPYDFYQSHTQANMERAKKELGFVPMYPPEKGIGEYVRRLQASA